MTLYENYMPLLANRVFNGFCNLYALPDHDFIPN